MTQHTRIQHDDNRDLAAFCFLLLSFCQNAVALEYPWDIAAMQPALKKSRVICGRQAWIGRIKTNTTLSPQWPYKGSRCEIRHNPYFHTFEKVRYAATLQFDTGNDPDVFALGTVIFLQIHNKVRSSRFYGSDEKNLQNYVVFINLVLVVQGQLGYAYQEYSRGVPLMLL